jgi:hypothetical protein
MCGGGATDGCGFKLKRNPQSPLCHGRLCPFNPNHLGHYRRCSPRHCCLSVVPSMFGRNLQCQPVGVSTREACHWSQTWQRIKQSKGMKPNCILEYKCLSKNAHRANVIFGAFFSPNSAFTCSNNRTSVGSSTFPRSCPVLCGVINAMTEFMVSAHLPHGVALCCCEGKHVGGCQH